jgi:ribosomal RNA-processing protein 8
MRKQKAKAHQFDTDAVLDCAPSSRESGKTGSQNKAKKPEETDQPKDHPSDSKASSLQQSFKERLSGSRFRVLNEELYTTTSFSAYRRFSAHPELYHQYHEGFRHQVGRWPVNPVNLVAKRLKDRALKGQPPGSTRLTRTVVADFGCGDAELARQLLAVRQPDGRGAAFVVHSFDLVASCDLVTACDMARVPLDARTVDVGVFCLSLMGTNLADFIREAHRVLKEDGVLVIAEVRSRFESKNGRDELRDFLDVMSQLAFGCTKEDRTNKMFLLLEFKKTGDKPDASVSFTAKPCIYKRR